VYAGGRKKQGGLSSSQRSQLRDMVDAMEYREFWQQRGAWVETQDRGEIIAGNLQIATSVLLFEIPSLSASINWIKSWFKSSVGLTDDVAKTFQYGRYKQIVTDKPIVLKRYYDNVNSFAKGRFMTNSTSSFKFYDRMGLAVKPTWNGMTKIATWEIPAGTTIYKGRAAMQFPWLGGKTQYFVPELETIKRIMR